MKYSYKKSNRRKLIYIPFIVIIIIAIYLSLQYSMFQSFISTTGCMKMEVSGVSLTDNPNVLLKNGCYELTILISPWQAEAIQEGLEEATRYRPYTHDIISEILSDFSIDLTLVKITKLHDSTYFAELYLQGLTHLSIMDIRPSDAIAIAVRTNTPIYVNQSLVTKTC